MRGPIGVLQWNNVLFPVTPIETYHGALTSPCHVKVRDRVEEPCIAAVRGLTALCWLTNDEACPANRLVLVRPFLGRIEEPGALQNITGSRPFRGVGD
jgi:hypothetical protein